jgi:hypothetical protein
MLAVVDDFVHAGMQVRAGAAAQVASSLNKGYLESAVCKTAGRAHAGHAAADDGNGTLRILSD